MGPMQQSAYNTIAPPGYDATASSVCALNDSPVSVMSAPLYAAANFTALSRCMQSHSLLKSPPRPARAFSMHMQGILDAFESMTLGPGAPGQADPLIDPAYYPRPTGEDAETAGLPPPPFQQGNCDPRFMRLTVNAIPSQQVSVGLHLPGTQLVLAKTVRVSSCDPLAPPLPATSWACRCVSPRGQPIIYDACNGGYEDSAFLGVHVRFASLSGWAAASNWCRPVICACDGATPSPGRHR